MRYLGPGLVAAAVVVIALVVVVDLTRPCWGRPRVVRRDVISRCPGPLIWYEVPPADPDGTTQGLLECAARGCTYLIATPQPHDLAHRHTPLMRVPT